MWLKIAYRSDMYDKQSRFQIFIQQENITITHINIPVFAQNDSCTHQYLRSLKNLLSADKK
jgi:nitrite reductase/ring-hydroxylating ferredoxin subunit